MSDMSLDDRLRYDSNCPVANFTCRDAQHGRVSCRGGMYHPYFPGDPECEVCLGTGRDPIPWAELFKGKRDPRT